MRSLQPTRHALGVLMLSSLLVACSDDDASSSGGGDAVSSSSTGGGGAAGQPPTLTAPASITIGEGRTVVAAADGVDPDGGEVTIAVDAPAGIDVEATPDGLVVHAAHGAASSSIRVVATDDEGETAETTIAVDVAPLAWTERVTWISDEGPEAREHASVLVDDASGSIYVMFGSGYAPYLEPLGDAWRFDVASRTWSACELAGDVPPPGGSKRLAGRRGSGEGLLQGGYGEGQQTFGEVYRVVADGDVLTFEEVPQESPPGVRLLHVFAYDPGTDTYVLYGGASTSLKGDTWTMRLEDEVARWTLVDLAAGPPARYGAFHGMDEEHGRLVLFSGQTSVDAFGQDTWILDVRAEGGPTWTEVTPPGSPPGRRNGTSVWDPTGPRLFVFGGTSDGATSQPGLFALDARPGREAWAEVDRPGQPMMRSSGFGAFAGDATDPDAAVWMGFGNDDDVYRDLARLGY